MQVQDRETAGGGGLQPSVLVARGIGLVGTQYVSEHVVGRHDQKPRARPPGSGEQELFQPATGDQRRDQAQPEEHGDVHQGCQPTVLLSSPRRP